ncbi:rhomboid family intramembrane serine protease [Candidatus Finniella inopinata]|uniref:Rhomboid family intramembrane serine protease n=1 Tax=Candidatus Finniella inopinata TaxID=1696036 RepID=A0A4Q7DMN4_9PROT|nr:rhomboid family intramembrane serine protease [Candidatus Finniella inopinata]RZI46076.1 rhomboid family intramembrane serine protease [Candidatus Finniella inopinata]
MTEEYFVKPSQRHIVAPILILLISAVFALQYHFSFLPSGESLEFHISTLVAMGGSGKNLVNMTGEYYRLLTCNFLHSGPAHFLCNIIALFFALKMLEIYISRSWILFIFMLGCLGSSCLSLFVNDPAIVSIGASGGIMALFASILLVASSLVKDTQERTDLFTHSLRVLIPSLIPSSNDAYHIDFAGHLGGAITGGILTYTLIMLTKRNLIKYTIYLMMLFFAITAAYLTYGVIDLSNKFNETKNAYFSHTMDDIKKGDKSALEWIKKAAEEGESTAQLYFGIIYLEGYGLKKDIQKGLEWIQKSVNQENTLAQWLFGLMYIDGVGVQKNLEKAFELIKKAALKGNMRALSFLGKAYQLGDGVNQNHDEAIKYYRLAANQGYALVYKNLGYLLEMQKNYKEAIKYYELAAAKNIAFACNNLGYLYQNGIGVEKNEEIAVQWFKKGEKEFEQWKKARGIQ